MNDIGKMGRLGNQMFQYAALRTLAQKFNYWYCLPIVDTKIYNEDLNLFDTFKLDNIPRYNTDLYNITISDDVTGEGLGFNEDIFNKCPDNVNLHGYFQDIRYFQGYEQHLKDYFIFKDEHLEKARDIFYSAFDDEPVISLHIRRGDYVNFPWHPMQTINYYKEALSHFDTDLKVIIFGDEVKWCFGQEFFSNKRFLFSRHFNVSVDLCMQTLCQYHIISNSTLSWWGAWLAQSKKTIKPKFWFAEHLSGYNDSVFLNVPGWISL